MTQQEQFKAEMAAIFKKYHIEMVVVEKSNGHYTYVTGVNFFGITAVKDDKGEHSHYNIVDFNVGTWSDFQSFE